MWKTIVAIVRTFPAGVVDARGIGVDIGILTVGVMTTREATGETDV